MESESPDLRSRKDTAVVKLKDWKTKILPFLVYALFLLASLDLVTLVIGAVYIHKCPGGPYIPIFLVVTGVIGMVAKIVTQLKKKVSEENLRKITAVESFLHTAAFIFFILGSIWTYRIYEPSYDSHDEFYCNKTCYLYAFIYITIIYSLILALLLMMCCSFCCIMCGTAVMVAVQEPENV